MAEEKKTSKKAEKTEKSKSTKKKSKKNPFKSIASFFKSVKSEGKKVVWAAPKEVLRNTIIVLIVVAIAGVSIYAVDSLLSLGMKGIKSLAETTTVSQDAGESTEAAADNTTAENTTESATESTK